MKIALLSTSLLASSVTLVSASPGPLTKRSDCYRELGTITPKDYAYYPKFFNQAGVGTINTESDGIWNSVYKSLRICIFNAMCRR
ncbi:hypothetical protein P8C59_003569 [Phyllachora maydis]|uniref:Uncharacterized protein n=1 Tax=Phyllachora maydis TaxID=1825666 RepID=A0AAD9MBK0_9PEZI|nr:hypothetical protein P8C59_003569 [Phyllachora maydis]